MFIFYLVVKCICALRQNVLYNNDTLPMVVLKLSG